MESAPEVTTENRSGVRWYLWPNLLSLDAPLVAVAWLWLMAHSFSVYLPEPKWQFGILATSVWVLYVIDRLLDGLSVRDPSTLTPRHRFYKNHPLPFLFLVPAGIAFALYGVLYHAPATLFLGGLGIAFISLFYLMQCAAARLRSRVLNAITVISAVSVLALLAMMVLRANGNGGGLIFPSWLPVAILGMTFILGLGLIVEPAGSIFHAVPKEIFCGFTFAIGVCLPVIVLIMPARVFAEVLLLGCLFSLNCIAIALYERRNDSANDPIAVTKIWPRVCAHYPNLVTAFAVVAAMVAFRQSGTPSFQLLLGVAIGAALLAGLHTLSSRLNTSALRVLSDLVLLVPPAALYLYSIIQG